MSALNSSTDVSPSVYVSNCSNLVPVPNKEPDMDQLTHYLKSGEMDNVLSSLEESNRLKSFDCLQLPLSRAFGRAITAIDMNALQVLFDNSEELLAQNKQPTVDAKGWLKAVLKLIWALHRDGAWDQKVKGLNHTGRVSERWLVQGFFVDEVYHQLQVHQWAARFSGNFPGSLVLAQRIEAGEGVVKPKDTYVDVGAGGVFIYREGQPPIKASKLTDSLDQFEPLNVEPACGKSTLNQIKQETEGHYWKYHLASMQVHRRITDDELTQHLVKGEMDQVLLLLGESGDFLQCLKRPLSHAFKREITTSDIAALRTMFWECEGRLTKSEEQPTVDAKGWLKATLKLIWALHRDGAWNQKVKGLDRAGKESERWLIQGFIISKDDREQLQVHQWLARFSMSLPGTLALNRRIEDEKGEAVFTDTSVDVDADGVVMYIGETAKIKHKSLMGCLDQSDRHNVPPTIKNSDALDRINRETEHRYWKYNLASVTRK